VIELLSAYLPIDRLSALSAGRSLPDRTRGAALFADISGFTALTEALERSLGAHRGGEELTMHLNAVYGALIDEVNRFRGSVIGFSGDAITCWFDGDDGFAATACGLHLHQVMTRFRAVPTDAGPIALAIKVAVAAGPARRFSVGDPERQLVDVLSGSILDRMASAEKLAKPFELVVSEEVATAVGARASIAEWRTKNDERFAVISAVVEAPPPDPWPKLSQFPTAEQLRPWLLPPVYQRLATGGGGYLAELRQAAALFVRFGGLDYEADDGVHSKLDAYIRWTQTVLARYEGSLIQLTTGDKGSYFYAAFGAPIAHEDVIPRALAAALELRSPPLDLSFVGPIQIGLSAGRMRTGAYGSVSRRTYGVLGDETNVAARLMTTAKADQILTSAAIADNARTGYDLRPLGEVTLKGKRPLSIFELVGRMTRATRRRTVRQPIIGREKERTALDNAIGELHARGSGAIVIHGEAGIGKTRLIGALLDAARAKRDPEIRCVISPCDAIERNTTYYPWRAVFARLFDIDQLEDRAAARARVLEKLPASLQPLSTLLNLVLDIGLPETPVVAQLAGNYGSARVQRVLSGAFRALVGRDPTLLVFEDVHWMDVSSWNLIETIRTHTPQLLVALTMRSLDNAPESCTRLLQHPGTTTLHVDPMPPDDVSELVKRHLGAKTVPDALIAMIRDKAGGNPFFIEELASAIRDEGLIAVEAGACRIVRPLDSLQFPDTIEGIVTSRIDRLAPLEQLTLKIASVIGRSFPHIIVSELFPIEQDRARLPELIEGLGQYDLTARDIAPEPTSIFKQAVTQEVAYNLMLFEQRRQLHESAAGFYERTYANDLAPYFGLLAHHRCLAIEGLARPDTAQVGKAIEALFRAANRALEGGATPEAIVHLTRGLHLLGKIPESRERDRHELDLRCSLGAALVVVRGPTHEDVRREFARARELCVALGETDRLFEALFGLWLSAVSDSDRAGTTELSQQLLKIASVDGRPAFLFYAHQACGSTAVCDGNHPAALAHIDATLEIARTSDISFGAVSRWREPRMMSYCYRSWANWFSGNVDTCVGDVENAVKLARPVAHPLTLTQALSFGSLIHRCRREPVLAEKYMQQVASLATEHQFLYWIQVAASVTGWLAVTRGDLAGGVRELQGVLERDAAAGMVPLTRVFVLADLLNALTKLERYDEAMAIAREAKVTLDWHLAGFGGPEIHRLEGELWLRLGERVRATAAFETGLALARTQRARILELRACLSLWRMDPERHAPLVAAYNWFTEGHATVDLVEAKAALDEIAVRTGEPR
jgi:class 3 adenylate cyclase